MAIYLVLTRLRFTCLSAMHVNKHRYQVSVSHVRFLCPNIFCVPMKGPRAQIHRAAHIYLFWSPQKTFISLDIYDLLILNLLEVSAVTPLRVMIFNQIEEDSSHLIMSCICHSFG